MTAVIIVRYIPWRVMALPTPLLVLMVTLLPAPFILISEGIKRSHRRLLVWRSRRLLAKLAQPVFLYTQRPDSTQLLEESVLSQLPVTAVRLNQLMVEDRRYAVLRGMLPKQLGHVFPLLLYLNNGQLCSISLHDCVYDASLRLRSAEDIQDACVERLSQLKTESA